MIKTKLYAIKTQQGYGLFQKLIKRKMLDPFNFIIYKQQVNSLDKKDIKQVLSSGYIVANLDGYIKKVENTLDDNKNKEVSLMEAEIINNNSESKRYDYGDCFITYLGEYENSFDFNYPKYSKISLSEVFLGVTYWNIEDETLHKRVKGNNGKDRFDTLPETYLNYPLRGWLQPRQLLDFFNNGNISYAYFNDEWAKRQLEEHYKEYPITRPVKETIEEIKKQIPTIAWKKTFSSSSEKEKEYYANCDRIAKIIQEFIDFIDGGRKASSVEIKKLSKKLNEFEEETEFFGTMEAEDLFMWFVKYFKSINYPKAIEILDSTRDW